MPPFEGMSISDTPLQCVLTAFAVHSTDILFRVCCFHMVALAFQMRVFHMVLIPCSLCNNLTICKNIIFPHLFIPFCIHHTKRKNEIFIKFTLYQLFSCQGTNHTSSCAEHSYLPRNLLIKYCCPFPVISTVLVIRTEPSGLLIVLSLISNSPSSMLFCVGML